MRDIGTVLKRLIGGGENVPAGMSDHDLASPESAVPSCAVTNDEKWRYRRPPPI